MTPKTRPLVAIVSVLAGFAFLASAFAPSGQANAAPVATTIDLAPIVIVGETPSGRRVAGEPEARAVRKAKAAKAPSSVRIVALDQGGRPGARSVRAFGL